jgi:hypothetical protein
MFGLVLAIPPRIQPFVVPFDTLVKSLRRNFNCVSPTDFAMVVRTFLAMCNVEVPPLRLPEDQRRRLTTQELQVLDEHRYLAPRPLDTLREALSDVQSSGDMNNSPFRHVMVISQTLAGLDILLEQLKRNNPQRPPTMVYVSSFSGEWGLGHSLVATWQT